MSDQPSTPDPLPIQHTTWKDPTMTTKFVVEECSSITETTAREVDEYTSRDIAETRAEWMNSNHGSPYGRGTSYYVVEVDEDGNAVAPDNTTADPELDALIMGDGW